MDGRRKAPRPFCPCLRAAPLKQAATPEHRKCSGVAAAHLISDNIIALQ